MTIVFRIKNYLDLIPKKNGNSKSERHVSDIPTSFIAVKDHLLYRPFMEIPR